MELQWLFMYGQDDRMRGKNWQVIYIQSEKFKTKSIITQD